MANATFKARLSYKKFLYTGFTPEELLDVGQVAIEANFARWDRGMNVYDLPSKPLSKRYAQFKAKIGAQPVRDLKLSGVLRDALKPLSADQAKVICGVPDGAMHTPSGRRNRPGKAGTKVSRQLYINEILSFNIGIDRQWGVAPSDGRAVDAYVRKLISQKARVKTEG